MSDEDQASTTSMPLAAFQAQRAVALQGDIAQFGYVMPDHAFLSEILEDAELHRQHVLPGARRAITERTLKDWLAAGLDTAAMVARVNGED